MIVTFYSYKGGVGRSMALANVAEWFRLQGLRVVMVDWDLEAPGLESFFSAADSKERKAIVGQVGVIDLITSYRDMFASLPARPSGGSGHDSDRPPEANDFAKVLQESLPPLRHFLRPVKGPGSAVSSNGSLHLLPAGCRTDNRFDEYAETVQSFDWADLYANFRGEEYFEWMRSQLDDPAVADIVLIDSRTGVSEMSGMCTRQLADVVVILCAPNDQNLEGVAMMARSFTRDEVLKARAGRPLQLILVASRVDVSEGRAIDQFEEQFKQKLDVHTPVVFKRLATDFQRLRVPYVSTYSYSERLAVGDPEGAKSLQEVYRLLAMHIVAIAPVHSELKRKCTEELLAIFGTDALEKIDEVKIALESMQRTRLDQLKRALEIGAIDIDTFDAAVAAISAQLSGSGAIAQGPGALALGAGSLLLRDNHGTINLGVLIQTAAKHGASEEDLRRAYLARILTKANQLPFAGDTGGSRVRLSAVYTALLTQRSEADAFGEAIISRMERSTERDHLSALDVLNFEPRLVLLGGPGSGKSTFVNIVALSMAGEMLGLAAPNLATLVAPPSGKKKRDEKLPVQRWEHQALLPVQVVLRDLASSLPAPGTAVNAETVWTFVCKQLADAALEDFAPYLRAHLLRDGGLELFDGLDEVPDALNRREQIMQLVQDFAATFSKCRFLVTSRTYAYQRQSLDKDDRNESWKLADFADVQLLPFTPAQMHGFVDAWFGHMVELSRLSPGDSEGRADLLKRTIDRNPRLAELAERPLLLTLIARLHTEGGGALPEKREELYMQAVDLLLNQWEGLKVRFQPDGSKVIEPSLAEWLNADRDAIRRELDKLAFEAHRDQADLVGTANIRQRDLIAALLAADPRDHERKLSRLEEHLSDRAGLLAAHGVGYYQFPHRSFQEYLAACHLTVDRFPDELGRLLRADPNRWREVTLLAAAKAARGASDSVWNLVEALSPEEEPPGQAEPVPEAADLWGALLAGQALWETGLAAPSANTVPRNEKKRLRVQRWLRAVVERGWLPPVDRALAGRALSVLGDDRDFDELVSIPGGEFWMGDDADEDATPRHLVRLPAYKIGKFPVTNGQYRRFIQATGRPWGLSDMDRLEKRNHPASFLDWHDALAYCGWLTTEWRASGRINEFELFTLPSEAEWEYAARGKIGHLFPWGNEWREDVANTVELGIGDSSAVGSFPAGASNAGCLDLAGNVWEWTRSLWGSNVRYPDYRYPYQSALDTRENLDADDTVRRVARGGSWFDRRGNACCAVRHRNPPAVHGLSLGFRVVLLSEPGQ